MDQGREATTMQSVIGAYSSSGQAARAVRELERHMSIQGVVVVDRRHVAWRKLHPEARRDPGDENFLVVMIGGHDAIERARALLRASRTSVEPRRLGALHPLP